MSRWKRKIEKLQSEIIEARKKLDDETREKRTIKRAVKKTGRPPIPKQKLEEAELLAYQHPIPWVAFKLDIGLRTLYNHGITRKNLEAKLAAKQKEQGNAPAKP
jgi:hypothetical protein